MNPLDILTQRNRKFKKVFLGSEEGRYVLSELYKFCGMNTQIYSGDDTAFRAGKHRVGQFVQGILAQDEQDISEILKIQGRHLEASISDGSTSLTKPER